MDTKPTIEDLERRLAEAEATIRADAVMKAELSESEERQAYFLALSDALRPLADQEEIQAEAMRLLGEKIGVNRAQYYIADDTGEYLSSTGGYSNGIPAAIGNFHLIDFGKYAYDGFHAGETQVVSDARTDPRISEAVLRSYETVGFLAYIGVPFVQRGRLVGTVAVHQSGPRQWTVSERIMVEETAERAGIAVEQARAESALRESEEKYRTLFDAMIEGFYYAEAIFDEHGRCVDLFYLDENAAAVRMIGQSAKGRRLSELASYEQHWRDIFGHTAKTGEPQRLERFASPDGIWYEFFVFKPEHARGNQFAVVFNDVTARHEALEALRESEERQTFLLKFSDALRAETTADMIGMRAIRLLAHHLSVDRCYMVSRRHSGNLWDVGPEVRTPGLPSMPPVLNQDHFPEALRLIRGQTLAIDNTAARTDFTNIEKQGLLDLGFGGLLMATLRTGEGNPAWAMVAASTLPRRWTSSEIRLVEDVGERTWAAIERARAEAKLKESEARFQQFAEASAAGLWIRDANTLAMEFVSPAVASIYGTSIDVLLGDVKRWASLVVPDDREVALEHLDRACKGEAVIHEFRIQRPSDGAFRWIRNTDFPLHDGDRIARIGGIAEDITGTRQLSEHQAVLLSELQHRVRNIMGMIRSMANRTKAGAASVGEYGALLEGRLLALARVQALLTRHVNVGGSLRNAIESEVSAQAHHGGQFELTGPDVTLSPKAVEVLTLAFHELSTNALKYGALSVPDGRLTVRWTPMEKRGAPWLALDWIEQGAPPGEPSTRRGFGSELIEGRIPYELRGTGKIFLGPEGAHCHLEFPLREGESILETDAPQPTTVFGGSIDMTGAPDLSGMTVLVVEDDYYMATDTAAALQGAGADVLGPCSDEITTRDLLKDRVPTHAILDLNLGGGGPRFEIAHLLKSRGVPFIFLTGYDPDVIPDDLADVVRLQKPVEFRAIVEAVSKL